MGVETTHATESTIHGCGSMHYINCTFHVLYNTCTYTQPSPLPPPLSPPRPHHELRVDVEEGVSVLLSVAGAGFLHTGGELGGGDNVKAYPILATQNNMIVCVCVCPNLQHGGRDVNPLAAAVLQSVLTVE